MRSPPPTWASFQEPEQSEDSDDDSDILPHPLKRTRKDSSPQRPRKRRHVSNDHGGPARNLVAPRPKLPSSNGPSNGPTRHASKASASASQPRPAKGLMRVKRTRVEKDRLRTGLSSSEEPEGPRNTVASPPSASAPVPNKAAFNRDALQHRFSMVALSVPSATAPVKGKAKTVPTEIIEIVDSDEEPTPSKLKSKPFVPSNKPKFVASRSNKEIIAISSDESDGPPSRKSVPQEVARVGIPSSLAPTDADATPPIEVEPHRASTVLRDATPPPTQGRGTQGIPSSSPRLHSKPNGLLPSLEDNTAVQPLNSPFILRDEGPSGATPSPNPLPSLTHSPSMSPPPPEESISAPPSPPTRSPSRRSSTRVAFPLLDLRTVSSSAPGGAWKPRLQTARTAPLPSTNPKLSSPPPNVKQSRKSVNIPVSLPKRTASPPSSPPERSREPASPPSRPRSRLKSENTDATLSSMPAIIDLTLDDTPPSSPPATMEEIHPLSKEGLLRRFVDRISSIRGVNKVQTMSGDAHAASMSPDDPPSLDTQREENYPHSNDQGLLRSFADRISGIRGVNKAQTMSNDAASVNLDDPSQQMLESALDTELVEPEDIDGPQPVDTRMLSPETSAAQEKYSAQMGILHSGRLRQAYAQTILSRHRVPCSEEEEIGQDLIPSPIQQREEAMQLDIGNEFEQTQPSASDTEVVPAASRASPAPDGSPHLPNLAAMDISSSLVISPGRRSYDDTDPYYLEYLDDEIPDHPVPQPVVPGQFPEVDEPPPPAPEQRDANIDDSATSSSSRDAIDAAMDAFLASDNGSARSESPFADRPSSRSSAESHDVPYHSDDEDSQPPSPGSGYLDLLRRKHPSTSSSSDDEPPARPTHTHSVTATQYPPICWETFRQNFRNFNHRVYYAKDLDSSLHDHIHSYSESFRNSPAMRDLYEAVIRENTSEDEPEAPPIGIENAVDSEPTPPWEFYYTNRLWLGDDIEAPDMSTLIGCDCVGPCDPASTTCSCLKRQNEYSQGYLPGFQYDTKGRIRNHGIPIFECNAHCSCDDEECRNRVVQKGRKCEVVLRKTEMKGWGVFAKAKILAGTFIGIYSGEFILESECERRGLVYDRSGRTYLLDIDFYNVKRKFGATVQYGVDAYHVGNFTRFFNHSCDPNCRVCPCYINEPDERRPLIVFFATRDIAVDEEICFSYSGKIPGDEGDDESQRGSEDDDYKPDDDDNLPSHKQKNACYCGASNCTGKMFND